MIQVTQLEFSSPKIPKSFHGYKIAHVSDLHNARFGEKQERLIQKLKKESPELIAVTGDLIDAKHTRVSVAMEFIREAVKLAPVYYVTGNHEAWTQEYTQLQKELLQAGVHIIDDKNIPLTKNGESIRLLGLKDPAFDSSVDYEVEAIVRGKLEKLHHDKNSYAILLSHRPELFEIYVENALDLVLSGHAHGGQVRIPFVGGLVAPNQGFFPTYSEGVFVKNQTSMVVSRGLGNSIIPLRINNPPELIFITLKSN